VGGGRWGAQRRSARGGGGGRAGGARAVRSGGGLRGGAPRRRSTWGYSFHAGAARPVRSVGGLRRGAPRLRSTWGYSFHARAARPVRSVGGLRRGAPRLRSTGGYSFQAGAARPVRSVGGLRRGAPRLRPASPSSLRGTRFATDVGGAEPARGDFRRHVDGPPGECARERVTTRVGVGIGARGRRRPGECAEVGAVRRVEHERHLGESPRPAAARLWAELARDHAAEDRVLALGLDLVGDDEAALSRREELDRVDLHGFRIEEPTGHLGEDRKSVV